MRISVLTIGAIASILSINSVFATTSTVTSKDYVDAADALKQDKITAGTTGNVVLYNGTQNGQTQFTGRAIYDGANDYDSTTDANKLITAGAVDGMVGDVYDYVDDEISNIPAPELPTGEPNYVVTYDENGDIGGERGIYDASVNQEDKTALMTASESNAVARNALAWAGRQIQCAENVNANDCTLWRLPNLGYGASAGQDFTDFVD